MNDEIKEILDKLKDGNWYDELDLTRTMWIELTWEETHLLLDYITNLQQENEKLKLNHKQLKDIEKIAISNSKLIQENEELKRKLDRRYYKNEYERIKQENEEMKKMIVANEEQDDKFDRSKFYKYFDIDSDDKLTYAQVEEAIELLDKRLK